MSQLAIVGIACLFPGASTPEQYWHNLADGIDARGEGGPGVFGASHGHAGGDERHRIYCTRGGFVFDFAFDPNAYRLSPAYLGRLDRAFHWGLHVAREALTDSGQATRPGMLARTGVVIGNYSFPTPTSGALAVPLWNEAVDAGLRTAGVLPASVTRNTTPDVASENLWVGGLPARVIGRALGLEGPQLALDAACSSALYSVKLAADWLRTGRADLMLAGGICAPDPRLIHLSFSDLHAYPQDGFSQPFDRRSTGILTGQGAGMFALKRLADAQRDGDRVYAVIDGIGLSNDGAGRHLLAPNGAGQSAAYELAYAASGVAPTDIDYVECHATGTRLGDDTELEALGAFFARHGGMPPIGSVKANVGHLLTVAGLSSMLKVVLALQHESLPPTIGVEEPLEATCDRVVRAPRPWPRGERVRRAGVSAFGFGGTNAHAVMSEPLATPVAPEPHASTPQLSIVGMGCHFGRFDSLDAFERAVYTGDDAFRPLPETRWRGFEETPDGLLARAGLPQAPDGAYVGHVTVDPLAFKIPPRELAHFNQQHLLMLKVADDALRDAGFKRAPQGSRVGVVIAMEMEPSAHGHRARYDLADHVREQCARAGVELSEEQLEHLAAAARDSVHDAIEPNEVLSYIGNIMASRISSLWNLTGPCFTISTDSAGGIQALDVASLLLLDDSVDAVLVGAVDLSGGPENVAARARLHAPGPGRPGLSFGSTDGWQVGEGAGAVVVTRQGTPAQRVYATITGLDIRYPASGDADALLYIAGADAVEQAAAGALRMAGVSAADVDLLEAHAGGLPAEDAAELAGLVAVYEQPQDGARTCALGSAKALIGDTQCASGLAALIKTALCLHLGYLPATPAWHGPSDDHRPVLERSALYVPADSRPWVRRRRGAPRLAGISALGSAGACCHLILADDPAGAALPAVDWTRAGGELIVPVRAATRDALLVELSKLRSELAADAADARQIMRAAIERPDGGPLCAVLVAGDRERLLAETDRALRDLPAVQGEWSTPAGSYFTSRPQGKGELAFVFPGAFNSYPGMLRELFRAFPQLLTHFEAQTERPADTFRAAALYPRELDPADRRAQMAREAKLLDDIPFMLASGTTASLLHADLLRDVFALRPAGAFGYSLGESSMLFAMGGWEPGARRDDRISSTPLFRDRLTGAKRTVRELWALPAATADSDVWASHVLLTDSVAVRAALTEFPRVFLTHVNTSSEVVVAGDPQQCRALIERLGCKSARAPISHVMHCPAVDAELEQLAELNHHPARTPTGLRLLSAYDYQPIDRFDSDELAARIAHTLRSEIDFARLARASHADGFRYFVEVGPASTCTRWVSSVLAGTPHVAGSVDRRGAPATTSLSRLLARLTSHGAPVELRALADPPTVPGRVRSLRIDVPCGGAPVAAHVTAAALLLPPHRPSTAREEAMPPDSTDMPALDRLSFAADPVPPLVNAVITSPTTVAERPALTARSAPAAEPPALSAPTQRRRVKAPGVIWDEQDLLEFATGSIAEVFGERFAEVDGFGRRVRLPAPPYLFASRVTNLHAQTGSLEPASITTEYDIPRDAWYAVDGQAPPAVTIEAGQCDLLLVSFLGIDFENRGERVYRLLDSTLTFHGDLPTEGQTLRYDISIDRFVRGPEATLFFFSYHCYADGELILELKNACAGFFGDEQLSHSLGIVETENERRERAAAVKTSFKPLAYTSRTRLGASEFAALADGRVGDVFGPAHAQDGCNPSLRLPSEQLRMIDDLKIDRTGGRRGLGALTATKQLEPDGWYFRCHFSDDPVLAGSLVAEGAVQALQAYALGLGLHLVLPDARFQPIHGLETSVKVRGQITPEHPAIRYELEIVDIGLLPRPHLVADVLVYLGDRAVISVRNLGIQIQEKAGTPYRPSTGGRVEHFLGRRNAAGEPALLNELHMAHASKGDLAVAMGPEFEVYGERRAPYIPNGDFLFVDRVMALDGERGRPAAGDRMVTEYDSPPDAWYYAANGDPSMPNCIYMESSLQAAILLGYYLGATLDRPGEEYSIRNLDGRATLIKDIDLRGRTIQHESTLLASYAMPGAILQNYRYTLTCDGEPFYVGESLFGYFTADALANQVGLDAAVRVPTWLELHPQAPVRALDVAAATQRPGLRLGDGQLLVLDTAQLVVDGGRHGRGYVRATRAVAPDDWYFDCHFHRDPVMPGSLGVEAVLQAIQLFVMESGAADGIAAPRFAMATDVELRWKYRGQVLRSDPGVELEVHIKEVRHAEDEITVIADASLYKQDGLRIYELEDAAVAVRSGASDGRRS
ncbi:hypothetical protein OJ998_00920 [Solirubrobacter taibaiensis]|nr:hypothetical protein [Solirubrobacter taibaiensis]